MRALSTDDPLLKGMYWVQDAGVCSGVYAIEEGRTIIDVGNMYGLIDELQDLGPLDRLERILLTHSHFDHVGGMAEIYQMVAPDLYLHPNAREYLRLHHQPFPEFFDALERDGKIKFLKDGDIISTDPPLLVIHTPGHSAGDLSFYDEQSKTLFCGDTVLPHKLQNGNILSKPDEACGGRMQDKIATLQRLLALPVLHMMPGHGEPVFHKGADQIRIALFNFYKELYQDEPERAWIAMGDNMLGVGALEDARQCAAKAFQVAPESEELQALKERIEAAVLERKHGTV